MTEAEKNAVLAGHLANFRAWTYDELAVRIVTGHLDITEGRAPDGTECSPNSIPAGILTMPNVTRLRLVGNSQRDHCDSHGYFCPTAARVLRRILMCVGGFGLLAWPVELAADEHQPRVLNNLVTQLIDLRNQGLTGKAELVFTNPRPGFCLFSLTGTAVVRLNFESDPLVAGEAADTSAEVMRWLPAGRQTLHVAGRPTGLNVRTIPVLQHAFYDGGNQWTLAHGPYDWEFLAGKVLPNVNVMISTGPVNPLHLRDWKNRGRSWIAAATVPGSGREDVTADEAYDFWAASAGLNDPLMDGIIVDEFPGGDQLKYDAYRAAVDRISADLKFKRKTFSPYSCGGGGILSGYTGTDRCQEFARACLAGGGQIAIERYLVEQPTQAAATSYIHEELTSGWNMPRFDRDFPGVVRQTVMVLGYMSAVGESLNVNPGVDFKVFMDMQMQALATESSYAGLGGIQYYHSGYADAETVRWAGRLYRHYAIEGRTNLLSDELGFKYRPELIQNPDFAEGIDGWEIQPAEPGSMAVKKHAKYGYLQFRYSPDGTGDRFLWTKRSAQQPNVFRQELCNLRPGKLYSLKMVTSDYQDLLEGRSEKKLHALRIELENVDIPPGAKTSFQEVFPSHYARPVGAFEKGRTFQMNYHWRVFRAKANTATFAVFDWQSALQPGGPAGQELAFNFIEIQPYFD